MRWYQSKAAQAVPSPAPMGQMQSAPAAPAAAAPTQVAPKVPTNMKSTPRVDAFKEWVRTRDPNLFTQMQQDPNIVNGPMARKLYQEWSQSNPPGMPVSGTAPVGPQGQMQSTPQIPAQLPAEQFQQQLKVKNPNLWAQLEQIQGTPQYGQLLQRKFLEHQQGKPIEQLAGGVSWYRSADSVNLNTDNEFIDDMDENKAPGASALPSGDDNKKPFNMFKKKKKKKNPFGK